MVRTNANKDLDYFTIDRMEWLTMLAYRAIVPLLAERGMHPNAALDIARIAAERGLVEVEAGGNGRLHKFDGEALIFELEESKPYLVRPQTNAAEQKAGPARHPALDARDEAPGTPQYDRLNSLSKLRIANKIEAWKVEQAKAKQTSKKSA